MNARLAALALCSLSLLTLPGFVHAQDTNDTQVPQPPGYAGARRFGGAGSGFGGGGFAGATEDMPTFDIQIENGKLSLAPLADHPGMTNFWAPGTKTVPATMENISRYLRVVDTNLNVILSPGTSDAVILNLKLKTSLLRSIPDAIFIASGNTVSGNNGLIMGGRQFGPSGRQISESTLTFTSREPVSRSTVEVFNLSGYIQTLGKVDDEVVQQKLDDVQQMIVNTLSQLHPIKSDADFPKFKYHSGTKLLIVIGKPEAIEVARKIINALSGQQTNGRMQDLLLDTPTPSDQN